MAGLVVSGWLICSQVFGSWGEWVVGLLGGWLVSLWICLVVGLLGGCLVCWVVGLLGGWLVCLVLGLLGGWFVGGFVGWLVVVGLFR